jgi:type II secretory pathway pseudopilin PulG
MRRQYTTRRAITLAETVVATLIIGFVLVSTLQIVAPISRSGSHHANRLVASNLANELAEEIGTKLFTEPDEDVPDTLGTDTGERPAVRADFDDIDDYQSWSSSPPINSLNESYTNLSGWTRSVKIAHVLVADPTTESPTNTGLKKITITVSKGSTQLAQVNLLQSQSADQLGFISIATAAEDSK